MIGLEFTEQDQERFFYNFMKADHHKIRLKNFVLYLKGLEFPHSDICKLSRISRPTLASYLKEFKTGGFKSFEHLKWKGQASELNKFIKIIDDDFNLKPPKSITEAQQRIKDLTGISRSPTQIRAFLRNKLDYRYLKAGSLPGNGKNDDAGKEEERDDFVKKNSIHFWLRQKREIT